MAGSGVRADGGVPPSCGGTDVRKGLVHFTDLANRYYPRARYIGLCGGLNEEV